MDREAFLKYTFESINSDLKFAETKNTFLATVNLAIIGWVISFIFSGETHISGLGRAYFILFILIIVISTSVSIMSFFPTFIFKKVMQTKSDPEERFMFYKYNRNKYGNNIENFKNDIKHYFGIEEYTPVEKQLMRQIVDLSNVIYFKFTCFSIALFIELLSLLVLVFSICESSIGV